MMKHTITFVILFLVLVRLNAQQFSCGHGAVTAIQKAASPGFEQRFKLMQQGIHDYLQANPAETQRSAPTGSVYYIPVVFHIVYPTGQPYGSGSNISYSQIQAQLSALNAAFSKDYPAYNGQSHPVYAQNTMIRFCLAKTAMPSNISFYNGPQGTEYGVMRYGNTSASNHQINAASANALLSLTHPNNQYFPYNNYLNIWVVSAIGSGPGTTMGYAPTPLMPGYPLDGVVIRADVTGDNTAGGNFQLGFGLDQGKVLVHEVGHYLNLYHTFEGGCSGLNAQGAQTDACDMNGDYVCDTDPCTTQNYNCSQPVPNTCASNYTTGTTQMDMIENYMSYSDDNCMNTFTSGQTQRMWATLNQMRQNLWQTSNLSATGILGLNGCLSPYLISSIQKSTNNHCAGVSFTLSNIVAGNSATSRSWSLPGASPAASSANSVVVTYNVPGNYYAKLSVSNGTATIADSVLIQVADCSLDSSLLDRSHWYFGNYGELDFSGSNVSAGNSALTFSTMFNGFESTVSMSDKKGNLLFYTNSINLWNKNHQQVNNGDVFNSYSSTPGVISIPYPGDSTKYLLVSSPHTGGTYDSVYYAVYDIITQTLSTKRGFRHDSLPTSYGEPLTIVPHCNGRDYWLLCRPNYTLSTYDRAYSILLTPAGPANIGTVTVSYGLDWGVSGQWKSNHRGDRLVHAVFGNGGTGVLQDFDQATGRITNQVTFGSAGNLVPTGAIFSPNDSIVYLLCSFGANYMRITKTQVQSLLTQTVLSYMAGLKGLQMEMGPDKNIYVSQTDFLNTSMGRINNPDSWTNATYVPAAINFPANINPYGGLCNFMDAVEKPMIAIDFNELVTACNSRRFQVDSCWQAYKAQWQFGDGSTAQGLVANHTYTAPGAYTVKLILSVGNYSLPAVVKNVVIISSSLSVAGPQTYCSNSQYPAVFSTGNVTSATYTWTVLNGSISGPAGLNNVNVFPNAQGVVTVNVSMQAGSCNASGQRTMTVSVLPPITFTDNVSSLCSGEQRALAGDPSGGTYSGAGLSGNTFTAGSVGVYTVTYNYVNAAGCAGSASKTISVSKCAGLSEMPGAEISIHPNPSDGHYTIATGADVTWEASVYNSLGQLILQKMERSPDVSLDISRAPDGLYLLVLRNMDTGPAVKRTVVKSSH